MAALLRDAIKHEIAPKYAGQLLMIFGMLDGQMPFTQPSIKTKNRPTKDMLVEPLSQREMGVLRLLRSDLSGPEIARELIVSLSTLRTHTQNIYAKLGVNNRRAAVRRAKELDLL